MLILLKIIFVPCSMLMNHTKSSTQKLNIYLNIILTSFKENPVIFLDFTRSLSQNSKYLKHSMGPHLLKLRSPLRRVSSCNQIHFISYKGTTTSKAI